MSTITDPFAPAAERIVLVDFSEENLPSLQEQFPVEEGEEPAFTVETPDGDEFEFGELFVEQTIETDNGTTITSSVALGTADGLADLGFESSFDAQTGFDLQARGFFTEAVASLGRDAPTIDFDLSVPTSLFDFGDFGF